MKKYIIVVAALDWKLGYYYILSSAIGLLDGVVDWSIDLSGADKVIHVVAEKDVHAELKDCLSIFDAPFTINEVL